MHHLRLRFIFPGPDSGRQWCLVLELTLISKVFDLWITLVLGFFFLVFSEPGLIKVKNNVKNINITNNKSHVNNYIPLKFN